MTRPVATRLSDVEITHGIPPFATLGVGGDRTVGTAFAAHPEVTFAAESRRLACPQWARWREILPATTRSARVATVAWRLNSEHGSRLSGMRIGELSKRTGVSPRSLRYYEEQGLLTTSRSDAGQRHYSDAEVQRVSVIRQLFDAGMSSRVIATVLPCVETPSDPGVVESAFATMTRERARIDAEIAHLIETRDALDVLINANRQHRAELSTAPEPAAESA